MISPEYDPHPARIKEPFVAKSASKIIAAVEHSSPEAPTSLDIMAEDGIVEFFSNHLSETDELYRRYSDTMFGAPTKLSTLNPSGIKSLLRLTTDSATNLRKIESLRRGTHLGVAAFQIAEAGAMLAKYPDLGIVQDDVSDSQTLIRKGVEIAEQAGNDTVAHKLKGNIQLFPNPRFGYPGQLLSTLVATLMEVLNRTDDEQLKRQIATTFRLLPSKTLLFDAHTQFGRPTPDDSRRWYEEEIATFMQSLGEEGSSVIKPISNIRDPLNVIENFIAASLAKGKSLDAALKGVATNSMILGRLTERIDLATPSSDGYHIEESGDDLHVTVDTTLEAYNHLPEPIVRSLERSAKSTGICPARYPTLIGEGGHMHNNLLIFSDFVHNTIGAKPHIILERQGTTYVDPAALALTYALAIKALNIPT